MAVRGTPNLYMGKMYQGVLSNDDAEKILKIREATQISHFKEMIFNFPTKLVKESIQEIKSIREMLKEQGANPVDYLGELRDYQTVGVAFMYQSPRSILADGVGLGKTVELAALFNYLYMIGEMKKFLVAVENTSQRQVQEELIKFTGFNIVALPSDAVKMKRFVKKLNWSKVDGIVIKHSTLRSNPFYNILTENMTSDGKCKLFDTFVLDESSVIKNNGTMTYEYTQEICSLADRVHLLNATAFETKLLDLYYQIDMMDKTVLPSKSRIHENYCTFNTKEFYKAGKKERRSELSGYKNQAVFKNRLQLFYFGRSKKDVGLDIPHTYKVYEIEPSHKQIDAISQGYRYMEVLNDPTLVKEAGIEANRKGVPKIDRLCTLIENEFTTEKVMVYCFNVGAQKVIKKELEKIGRKPVILNGEVVGEEREKAREGFNGGEYDVIITNAVRALNLHGGDVCIFYTMEFNPAKMEQIRGRIDRNVDNKTKTFVLLLYAGTAEYDNFVTVVSQRAQDARDLTLDTKTAVDYFVQSMQEE